MSISVLLTMTRSRNVILKFFLLLELVFLLIFSGRFTFNTISTRPVLKTFYFILMFSDLMCISPLHQTLLWLTHNWLFPIYQLIDTIEMIFKQTCPSRILKKNLNCEENILFFKNEIIKWMQLESNKLFFPICGNQSHWSEV